MIETLGMNDNARTTGNFACAEYSRDRERGRHITRNVRSTTNQRVACSAKRKPMSIFPTNATVIAQNTCELLNSPT